MRKYIILLYCLVFITLISCNKDFLEQPPSVDLTEDVVFSNETEVLKFIATTYQFGIPQGYPLYNDNGENPYTFRRLNGGLLAAACDEADAVETWSRAQNWNTGSISAVDINSTEDNFYDMRWMAIRNCNIILERIESVPGASAEFKKQAKGDAYFIRALCHFEAFKRYGGVPLVKKKLTATDDLLIPRSTIEETVNFIMEDCATALSFLPPTQATNMRGRADQGVVLALKARTLLYAASPLFNTATPYLDLGANNKLICYGNYDQSRWQKAADAAKATLDWASANGCALLTAYGVNASYEKVTMENDNVEIILANKAQTNFGSGAGTWSRSDRPFSIIAPKFAGSTYGDGGTAVPFNFVKLYEKKDGTPQTWNMAGGNDLDQKYAELDPRFAQTIGYHGSVWSSDVGKMSFFPTANNQFLLNLKTGNWMHKLIPRDLGTGRRFFNWVVFRLGEVYLNYAEALNEANSAPPAAAYEAVKLVRERSGMPPFPAGLTKEQFREKLRTERAIELAYEEHRFWDIRRWLIAGTDGIMQGAFYAIDISDLGGGVAGYTTRIFENRVWTDRMFLNPFLQSEVYKGYLVQNPGW